MVTAIVKQMPWWIFLTFIPLATVIGLFPWIHNRWPWLLPLTGPCVTLYDDRITCQSGKSQPYIALDNIAECLISTQKNKDASYSVLSFTPKNGGFGGKFLGVLTETAISDSAVTEQVIAYLRERGIAVRDQNSFSQPSG